MTKTDKPDLQAFQNFVKTALTWELLCSFVTHGNQLKVIAMHRVIPRKASLQATKWEEKAKEETCAFNNQ